MQHLVFSSSSLFAATAAAATPYARAASTSVGAACVVRVAGCRRLAMPAAALRNSDGNCRRMDVVPKATAVIMTSRRVLATTGSTMADDNESNERQGQRKQDLAHAAGQVRQHDPAGYLPGRLLPDRTMSMAYYAVRGFWVETGLRFGTTAAVPPNATPLEHLEWWQDGVNAVFDASTDGKVDRDSEILFSFLDHPTLRLIHSLLTREKVPWTREPFDDVLGGRRRDLDVRQYDTVEELMQHAELSCGSLQKLVLASGGVMPETSPAAYKAARLQGIGHGLVNAVRTSIPVLSITGKLVVPAELTTKYNVRSPRYLLSALAQGTDPACVRAMQDSVQDLCETAIQHLERARELRPDVLRQPGGDRAAAVLLPAMAAETWVRRLQHADYLLTDRNLRNVSLLERGHCAARMVYAYYRQMY